MIEVAGFRLDPSRRYDPERHLWVAPLAGGRLRVGMDPLGAETAGDLVQLSLAEPGTAVRRGEAVGTVEAAKFVGPIESPVSGVLVARNEAVLADPGLVNRDPLGGGWLFEVEPSEPGELEVLLSGEAVVPWFEARAEEYRLKGMIAE